MKLLLSTYVRDISLLTLQYRVMFESCSRVQLSHDHQFQTVYRALLTSAVFDTGHQIHSPKKIHEHCRARFVTQQILWGLSLLSRSFM